MLMCKACNTRFGHGIQVCPSCGRRAATHAAEATSSGSGEGPLPSSEVDVDVDLELEDDIVLEDPAPRRSAKRKAKPSPKKAAGSTAPATQSSPLRLDSRQVGSMLADEPWLLETGMNLYADDDGEPLGVDFPTPVGGIDILARDGKQHFVVILVPSADELSDSVSGMLQRMGWVRKHLTDAGEEVRGMIVTDHVPEELSYAAAGTGGAISFKGFRFSLKFHDLEA
jgi:hypothetical protein